MDSNLYVIVMAGGSGTRFWPYSRKAKPKQFLDVLGTGETLIQTTYKRFLPLCPKENIFVVTTKSLVELTKTQLQIGDEQVLAEPMGKNTTPCIAYACYKIGQRSPNAVVVTSPADHLILNETEFRSTISHAVRCATGQDKLITLGISPTSPKTGYGYIQFTPSKQQLKKVKTFTEKPTIETAKKFIDQGDFVWNAGIFVWNVPAIKSAMQKHQPKTAAVFNSISSQFYTTKEEEAVYNAYEQVESISIDYGIMEKAKNTYVCLGDFGWSDLGSWNTLHALQHKDNQNNTVDAHALIYDTHNSIIKGPKDKLIVAQGLENCLVGVFDNVVIVCKKDQESLFRKFISDLKTDPDNETYL